MKIIFVGVHNKPGKLPLCRSTKSGKLIDRIIREGGLRNTLKTNLFDVDFFPPLDDIEKLARDWHDRVNPGKDDIIVLLGASVHEHFISYVGMKVAKVPHPASMWGKQKMNDYVSSVINRIEQLKPFYA